jgi:hypothetical protein
MTYCSFRSMATLLLAVAIVAAQGCQGAPAPAQSQPPATPAAVGPFSEYSPAQPYRQFAVGLLAQTAYVADADGPFAVELWDLIVGPGQRSEPATLPGGAVFEIRSGTGRVTVAGQDREAPMGATFSIPEGQPFTVVNGSADQALTIRATVVRARQ